MNHKDVKPCPEDCSFDWRQFHRDLDVAVAHLISESDRLLLLSNTTIMELLEYSNAKRKLSDVQPTNSKDI